MISRISGANRGPSSIQKEVLCGATTYAPEKIRCASRGGEAQRAAVGAQRGLVVVVVVGQRGALAAAVQPEDQRRAGRGGVERSGEYSRYFMPEPETW